MIHTSMSFRPLFISSFLTKKGVQVGPGIMVLNIKKSERTTVRVHMGFPSPYEV